MIHFILLCLSLSFQAHGDLRKAPPARVRIYRVAKTELIAELKYPALVVAQTQGKLTSEVSGIVTTIKKSLGEHVTAQETVLLVKQNQVGLEYHDYAVRSPVTGVVSQLETAVGQYLQAGQIAGTVIDPQRMKVTIEAPAQDLPKLRRGMTATYELDNEKIPLEITGVSPTVNQTTGTSLVELMPVKKKSKLLRAGSVGRITVYLPPTMGLAVPARAIITLGPDTYVRTLDDHLRVHFTKVTIGPLLRTQQVVNDGLKIGDQVVTDASGHLKEGDTVVAQDDSAVQAN